MNSTLRQRLCPPLVLAGVLACASAHATIVTYQYSAAGRAGTTSAGATVTGTFGFDDSVPNIYPPGVNSGVYLGAGFLNGTVSGGSQDGYSFDLAALDLTVGPSQPGSPSLFFVGNSGTLFYFEEYAGSPLTSEALPTQLSLSDWTTAFLRVYSGVDQPFYDFTSLSRVDTAAVPEPATLALASLALVGAAAARRRKA